MYSLIGGGSLVIYAAYALIGVGVFYVSYLLLKEQEARAAEENLEENRNRKASNPLVALTRPFFSQYLVPIIRGKAFWDVKRKHYRRKLVTAGLKNELTADEFIAFKMFLIGFFPVILLLVRYVGETEVDWYYSVLSAIFGWFYPDIWIKSRIEQRQKKIRNAMPFIVDLLALSTEAGLDFIGAIGKVVEKAAPSPLVEEFEQLLKEIKVGSSRGEAMREMAIRIDMSEVNSFVAILVSADQMGASIGRTLRQQSEQIRNERFTRAEKAGAAAGPKLIIATVIFVMPSVVAMILGPVILQFMSGEGSPF
ncbi:MAG: type II secretion system F family protein [Bacteriovoracia bacterium]